MMTEKEQDQRERNSNASELVGRHGRALFGKKNPKLHPCVAMADNQDGTIKVQWDEGKKFTKRLPVEKFVVDKEPEKDRLLRLPERSLLVDHILDYVDEKDILRLMAVKEYDENFQLVEHFCANDGTRYRWLPCVEMTEDGDLNVREKVCPKCHSCIQCGGIFGWWDREIECGDSCDTCGTFCCSSCYESSGYLKCGRISLPLYSIHESCYYDGCYEILCPKRTHHDYVTCDECGKAECRKHSEAVNCSRTSCLECMSDFWRCLNVFDEFWDGGLRTCFQCKQDYCLCCNSFARVCRIRRSTGERRNLGLICKTCYPNCKRYEWGRVDHVFEYVEGDTSC